MDLVVNSLGHGTHIFLNDGQAHFTELTKAHPLNFGKGGMSLALGAPSSSRNVPFVNDIGTKFVPPTLRKIPSTSPSSSIPPVGDTTKRSTRSGSVTGRPLTEDTYCFLSGPIFIQKRVFGMSISASVR